MVLVSAMFAQTHAQKRPGKVPPLYTGDALMEIERFIGSGGEKLAKDEFETASEAAQRIDKLFNEAKVNGHSLANVTLVVVPKCEYEAEVKFFECAAFAFDRSEKIASDNPLQPQRRFYIANDYDSYGLRWTWPTDPATARQAKADLRLAVVGRPLYSKKGLMLILSKMAMFNYTTGEIYASIKIEPKKADVESSVILQ